MAAACFRARPRRGAVPSRGTHCGPVAKTPDEPPDHYPSYAPPLDSTRIWSVPQLRKAPGSGRLPRRGRRHGLAWWPSSGKPGDGNQRRASRTEVPLSTLSRPRGTRHRRRRSSTTGRRRPHPRLAFPVYNPRSLRRPIPFRAPRPPAPATPRAPLESPTLRPRPDLLPPPAASSSPNSESTTGSSGASAPTGRSPVTVQASDTPPRSPPAHHSTCTVRKASACSSATLRRSPSSINASSTLSNSRAWALLRG